MTFNELVLNIGAVVPMISVCVTLVGAVTNSWENISFPQVEDTSEHFQTFIAECNCAVLTQTTELADDGRQRVVGYTF